MWSIPENFEIKYVTTRSYKVKKQNVKYSIVNKWYDSNSWWISYVRLLILFSKKLKLYDY